MARLVSDAGVLSVVGDAAGAFGLLNLDSQQDGGNIGSNILADWIRDGYQDALPLGTYDSAPSANFNSQHIRHALADRIGTELLFPVYRPPITGSGSGASYDIIGWVGFVPTSFSVGGSSGTIRGYFTQVIWQGLADDSGRRAERMAQLVPLDEAIAKHNAETERLQAYV